MNGIYTLRHCALFLCDETSERKSIEFGTNVVEDKDMMSRHDPKFNSPCLKSSSFWDTQCS
jgi:hypothetical protein